MKYQNTFKRREIKYMISTEQKDIIMSAIARYMIPDKYGRSSVRNIYFDTDDFRLIRRSLERPVYKEKLRLRSYGIATPESNIFVELKKKYKSVVYKRRLSLTEFEISSAFSENRPLSVHSQIADEIQYFRSYYENLKPKVFLSYDREAFYAADDPCLRITFDCNIMYRTDDLSLCSPAYGISILKEDCVLMEIKASDAIPLWLTSILTENEIFKTSFSKYGTAYSDMLKNKKGAFFYA